MTKDDKLTLFLGQLADRRDELDPKPSVKEYGFADDCRFAMSLSPRMRDYALAIFEKYGKQLGWRSLDEPPRPQRR